jgi:uncharacterized Zn finger protein (UPF0148 family)
MRKVVIVAIVFGFFVSLSGCASKDRQDPSGLRSVSASAGWDTGSRANARAKANKICAANGGGIKFEKEGSCGFNCEIYFRCFDYAARVAEIKREENARKEKELQQQQEQQRIAEQKRIEQQEEWERNRPQREAAAKAAQEAAKAAQDRERARLSTICPIYYIARQLCASAGSGLAQCMNIRIGKSYSAWDDRTCFNR